MFDREFWGMGAHGGRGGRHGHRGGHGHGPFGGGPGGDGGFPFRHFPREFFQMGGRARKGNIRAAILALLAGKPLNGYQLMQEIEQRSQGAWRPSSGSVYPTLQQLEDERLVEVETTPAGRVYQLTSAGRAYVKEHEDELEAPWETAAGDRRDQMAELGHLIVDLVRAAKQVASSGTSAQHAAAKNVLKEARRTLYRLLSEDEDPREDEP